MVFTAMLLRWFTFISFHATLNKPFSFHDMLQQCSWITFYKKVLETIPTLKSLITSEAPSSRNLLR